MFQQGTQLQRHQLMHKLLHEQPHLKVHSGEFREMFVLRSIYVVGPDAGTLASYTGYRRSFVDAVRSKYQKEAMKAYRAYINGADYEKSVVESIKDVGKTIVRAIQKRSLQRRVADFAKSLRAKGPFAGKRTEARSAR